MTEVVFVPSGRPVLRFVSVLGGLAVVLLALSWTGALAPRVQLRVIRSTFDNPAQSGTVTLTVTNRGPAAAYVGRVTSGNPYVHVAPAGTARVRRIGGGTSERINFSYRFDCAGFAPSPELRIRVYVRGVFGVGRWLTVWSSPEAPMCFSGRPNPPLP